VTWLPAFTRTIRRVESEGNAPVTVDCAFFPLLDESAICVLSVSGRHRERALRFDLSTGFSLLLRVDAAGPCAFPSDLRRLWNLAPLEEELRSGWNGPFAVNPGRTGLAGSITNRQEKFRKLGRTLVDRLLELHDLADVDWHLFANSLDLERRISLSRSDAPEALFRKRRTPNRANSVRQRRLSVVIDGVNLEPSLRDIEPNPGNLVHLMWSPAILSRTDLSHTTLNRAAGAVHIISFAPATAQSPLRR
jgi:hypothetical protein